MVTEFTPISVLIGGSLIGAAAVLLLALDGRIAGVSGVIAGVLERATGERAWRLLFLLGLIVGAGVYTAVFADTAPIRRVFPVGLLILGGLLVGYVAALSRGCTSGHGVCGLARLSVRALAATVTFLVVAIATTFVVRHVLGVGA